MALWLPFVDASEAGLWLFWILEREVLAVPRPALRIVDDELHSENGPAVFWPNGTCFYFWRGIQVSEQLILAPEMLTAEQVLTEPNLEVRRVMIDRLGADRLMALAKPKVLHSDVDQYGRPRRLLRIPLRGDEDLVMVEVTNSTAEPDATFKNYLLRVPPTVRTCQEAVAWTWNETSERYRPAVET